MLGLLSLEHLLLCYGVYTIIVDPFSTKSWNLCEWENDSICLAHLVVGNTNTLLSFIRETFGTLWLLFLVILLYYALVHHFVVFNSYILVVFRSFKFISYCSGIFCGLFVKLLWGISSWLASIVFTMVTFHVIGKLDLTIMVGDFGVVEVIGNVLCAMFTFRRGSVHVLMEVVYVEDNVVSSSFYQVLDNNPMGMFFIVTYGKFWIVGDNAFNNF